MHRLNRTSILQPIDTNQCQSEEYIETLTDDQYPQIVDKSLLSSFCPEEDEGKISIIHKTYVKQIPLRPHKSTKKLNISTMDHYSSTLVSTYVTGTLDRSDSNEDFALSTRQNNENLPCFPRSSYHNNNIKSINRRNTINHNHRNTQILNNGTTHRKMEAFESIIDIKEEGLFTSWIKRRAVINCNVLKIYDLKCPNYPILILNFNKLSAVLAVHNKIIR